MKIKEVNDEHILFDNGTEITFDHEQDCCECNYADFTQITPETVGYDQEFVEPLAFSFIDGKGFRFGNYARYGISNPIFVPCYSDQNGYYSSDINVHYNGECIIIMECEERLD